MLVASKDKKHVLLPNSGSHLPACLMEEMTTQLFPLQTFVATGTNLCLQFCPLALSDDKPKDISPSSESVNYDLEGNKVNLVSKFIMNGVCIKWVGYIDLETLAGKARLVFDEEQAVVSCSVCRMCE